MDGIVLNFLMDFCYDLILFPTPSRGLLRELCRKSVAYVPGVSSSMISVHKQ